MGVIPKPVPPRKEFCGEGRAAEEIIPLDAGGRKVALGAGRENTICIAGGREPATTIAPGRPPRVEGGSCHKLLFAGNCWTFAEEALDAGVLPATGGSRQLEAPTKGAPDDFEDADCDEPEPDAGAA